MILAINKLAVSVTLLSKLCSYIAQCFFVAMRNPLIKISVLFLFLFAFSSCYRMAHVFYNPDMCSTDKKRKGNFKQKDMDRRAKSKK